MIEPTTLIGLFSKFCTCLGTEGYLTTGTDRTDIPVTYGIVSKHSALGKAEKHDKLTVLRQKQ